MAPDRSGWDRIDAIVAVAERSGCSSFPPEFAVVPFRVDAENQEAKKKPTIKVGVVRINCAMQ
ncbi:hypothetical protein OUHCRE11_43160 [Enterobacter asburiae]|nr:hypothetical protein ENTKAS01_18010 [Enterobacter sp. AS-1]